MSSAVATRHSSHLPWHQAVPPMVAALAGSVAYALLSDRLRIGPPWLPVGLVLGLLVLLTGSRRLALLLVTRWVALAVVGVLSLGVASGAVLLAARLPGKQDEATVLLRDGALLWAANILTAALWYWEMDSGGPGARRVGFHRSTDFVFPQMVQGDLVEQRWVPHFVDYLFLAFNTSTAFSPTDTMVLSRRAKVAMMIQSLVSLVVVVVLLARAINTL